MNIINSLFIILIIAAQNLFGIDFLHERNCQTIEVWKGIESTFYPLESLREAIESDGDYETWKKQNCMREYEHIGSTYSYKHPRAHVILVDETATKPHLIASLILDAKKSNSSYLIGPRAIADTLDAVIIEEIGDSLYLYDIDKLPCPKASMITDKSFSVLSRELGSPPPPEAERPSGPISVLSSIERGSKKIDVPVNFNPSIESLQKIVLAVCEPTAQLLNKRRNGEIDQLILGPNIAMHPHHIGADVYVSPCNWTKSDLSIQIPQIKSKCEVWSAGVDTNFWSPSKGHLPPETRVKLGIGSGNKQPVIYMKNRFDTLRDQIILMCQYLGWKPIVLEYGKHNHDIYKTTLENANFMIIVSITESQGIALAEAWSMNVPTLYMVGGGTAYEGSFAYSHSAPYANPNVGLAWSTLNDLQDLLLNIDEYLPQFEPRRWVLRNMTDQISVLELLRIIREME